AGPSSCRGAVILQRSAYPAVGIDAGEQGFQFTRLGTVAAQLDNGAHRFRNLGNYGFNQAFAQAFSFTPVLCQQVFDPFELADARDPATGQLCELLLMKGLFLLLDLMRSYSKRTVDEEPAPIDNLIERPKLLFCGGQWRQALIDSAFNLDVLAIVFVEKL